jgi:hypothetical protein
MPSLKSKPLPRQRSEAADWKLRRALQLLLFLMSNQYVTMIAKSYE